MSWFSGTGFAKLLQGILGNSDFQRSAFDAVVDIGKKVLQYASHPEKVQLIANNLIQNPDVVVGAMVAGTEAEKLVDPKVVSDAKEELAKPGH